MVMNNFSRHQFCFLVLHGPANVNFFVKAPQTFFGAKRSVSGAAPLDERAAGRTSWLFVSTLYSCGERERSAAERLMQRWSRRVVFR